MQFPARFQGSHRVRQQCFLVAEDFELDPMAARIVELLENLPAESRHPDGIPGGKAARGVGENRIAICIDEIQHRATVSINQAFPADRDGDDLSAGKVQGLPHDLVVLIFPRPHNETIRDGAASQPQGFIGRGMLFDFDSGGHEFLSTSHEADDLKDIAFTEPVMGVLALGDQFGVHFHGAGSLTESIRLEQLLDGRGLVVGLVLSVDDELHHGPS